MPLMHYNMHGRILATIKPYIGTRHCKVHLLEAKGQLLSAKDAVQQPGIILELHDRCEPTNLKKKLHVTSNNIRKRTKKIK